MSKYSNTLHKVIRSRKAQRLFGLIMTLAMSLTLCSFLIQYRSLQDRIAAQRQWYGAWQAVLLKADEAALQEVRDNLVVDQAGIVQTATLADGTITGTGDDSFFDLASLSLKTGRLPETNGEAAVEAVWLDRQGLSYELGQEIRIGDEVRNLCGILDSYSANWTAGDHLPQIWTASLGHPGDTLVYMQAKAGYEDVFDHWKPSGAVLVRNMQLDTGYNPFSDANLPWTIVSLAALGGGLLLMGVVLGRWLETRQLTLIRLKTLGADTGQLMGQVFPLILGGALWSVPVLAAAGLILNVPWLVMTAAACVWAAMVLIMAGLAWRILAVVPAGISLHASKGHIPKRLPKGKKTLSVSMLADRWLHWNRKAAVFAPLLLAILTAAGAYTATRFVFDAEMEAQIQRQPDFRFTPKDATSHMPVTDLEKIREVSGVQEVYSYTLLEPVVGEDDWTLRWDDVASAAIFDFPEEYRDKVALFSQPDQETLISPVILEPDHLPVMTEVLKENGIENGMLQEGEIAIYLPEFSWMIQGDAVNPAIMIFPRNPELDMREDITFRMDTSLEAGDVVQLESPEGEIRSVTVRTVLRNPLNYSVDYQDRLSAWTGGFAWPYAVIVPEGFFNTDSVNHVEVWSPQRRDAAMQSQMAALASQGEMLLTNEASENRTYTEFFAQERLLYCILTMLLAVVWLFVLVWAVVHLRRSMAEFLKRFRPLQVSENTCSRIRRQMTARICLIILTSGLAALVFSLRLQFAVVPNRTVLLQSIPSLFDLSGNPGGVFWILGEIVPWVYGAAALLILLPMGLIAVGWKKQ